ncbi:tRNA glutamyl-Q(34) synthetase GluQRS [Thioalkalivibrio sp. HK1]|uniref:tRNA glutamyl-Q(34) synthetase GluQRS n=1 Tax=Thioalkalivibrio sp. HK1 TaxID=1469245 RepID=UPI0009DCF42A|nr:tRNA glutamyl-Q(34) synthetase GluQRS [Thioalkalivibrio sp. HK1]
MSECFDKPSSQSGLASARNRGVAGGEVDDRRGLRGRFAPSPTGDLHFGSLITALGSYLSMRRGAGKWLVRIEDIDTPRSVPGAADAILRQLERLGLLWDEEVIYQSRRIEVYEEALAALARRGLTFPCACSRKDLGGGIYPGTCRNGIAPGRSARSTRMRIDDESIGFIDAIQGRFVEDLARSTGDFVVHRADGIVAYHLAVVVDDAEQGIGEVMRGCDLLSSTPRQIVLQRALGLPQPVYAHLPLAVDRVGNKLGKRDRSEAIASHPPASILRAALRFLGQSLPPEARTRSGRRDEPPEEIIDQAIIDWDPNRIPKRQEQAVFADFSRNREVAAK